MLIALEKHEQDVICTLIVSFIVYHNHRDYLQNINNLSPKALKVLKISGSNLILRRDLKY